MINLIENKFNNIEWVTFLDSGVSWPILWVSVCTHWWEVVWLDILNYLFNEIDIRNYLLKWQIYFIVNNIKAANKMLDLIKNWKQITQQDLIESRFIDENMNRCCSVENLKKSIQENKLDQGAYMALIYYYSEENDYKNMFDTINQVNKIFEKDEKILQTFNNYAKDFLLKKNYEISKKIKKATLDKYNDADTAFIYAENLKYQNNWLSHN